jgi:hypothetical protein
MADDKNTSPLTNGQHLRLELVKLTYRHDRTPQDMIERAKGLEEYVAGEAEKPASVVDTPTQDGPI